MADPNMQFRGLRVIIIVVVVVPVASLAAGAGALPGMIVAYLGWGKAALDVGAAVGAGIGLLLLVAWFVVFVVYGKDAEEGPEAGWRAWKPGRKKP